VAVITHEWRAEALAYSAGRETNPMRPTKVSLVRVVWLPVNARRCSVDSEKSDELPKRLVSVRKHSLRVRRLSVAVTRTGGSRSCPMHSLQGVEPEGSMCEMVVADERPKVFV